MRAIYLFVIGAAVLAAPATASEMSWKFCNDSGCLETKIDESEAIATRTTILGDREVARVALDTPILDPSEDAILFDAFLTDVSVELQKMVFPNGQPVPIADPTFDFEFPTE